MKVIFLRSFLRDVEKIQDKKLKQKILEFILLLEKSDTLQLPNIKKLKGFAAVYRWRLGDYRLGFYKDGDQLELARFVKREDIFKIFP